MRVGIWVALVTVGLVWVHPPGAVAAATASCRQEARTVYAETQRVLSADSNDRAGFNKAFSDGVAARPECEDQIRTLYTWYVSRAKGHNVAFPFPAADDPHTSWAGPIGWWWNQLYFGLFGSNALLMWLFGWELFFFPIGLVLAAGFALLSGMLSMIMSPFRHRTAD